MAQTRFETRSIWPLLVLLAPWLVGCGGSSSEPTTVAQADTATASGGGAGGDSDYGDGGYGGGGYGGDGGGGGAYGGGGYGGGDGGAGYGGAGYAGAGYAGAGYAGAGYAGGGYDGGAMDGYGAGYGAGEAGYGAYGGGDMGFGGGDMGYAGAGYGGAGYAGGGYGGAGMSNANFQAINQFVRQNCLNCHGPQQTKGDVRLDGLTSNFADVQNAELWHNVLQQLEAGTMPPRSAGRPNPQQQQMVVSWIQQSISSSGFDLVQSQDYLAMAKRSFGLGKESEAVQLLYAYALAADDEEARALLSQSRWLPIGPRPAMTVRFAVGVDLTAPSTLTDIKPIGSTQMDSGRGGGGGGGYGGEAFGGFGGRAAAGATNERSFNELTGTFGEALVAAFESRWSSGELGTVFSDVATIEPSGPAQRGAPGGFGLGGAGYGGAGYGGGGYAGEGAGYGGGGMLGGPGGAGAVKRVMPGVVVTPGLVFVGTGSQAELLRKADEQGVDGLFIFDVEASQNRRTNLVNNQTRLRLMTVADAKAMAATSTLLNTEVERALMRDAGDDTVQKNIDRLFNLFDEKMRLTSMPPLKPEHALSRIRQLLADKDASMLSKLYETRLFNSMGLLSQEDMAKVYQIVLEGNEGEALAFGTVDDRKLVLGEILPN